MTKALSRPKFACFFSFRLLITFLFVHISALLFSQHKSIQGKWIADLRNYTRGSLVHQKIEYTILPGTVRLRITTSKQDKKGFFDHRNQQSNAYSFAIEKTVGSRKHGQLILRIPQSISGKDTARYGIFGFNRENSHKLRVQFSLHKIYRSPALAKKQPVNTKQGVLLVSQEQYKAYQQLPVLPALTPASFKQLRQAIQQQLQKSVYRQQIKHLDRNRHLHSEIPGQVFLQKGYNPYQSMKVLLDYQLKMVDLYKRQTLKLNLLNNKEKLETLLSGKHPDKNRQKAEIKTTRFAITLTQKKLAYLDLKQKLMQVNQQKNADPQKRTRLETQIKQFKQQIEILTQQQFKVPNAPVKFNPVRD